MEGLMLTSHMMRLMIHRWLKEMGLYMIYSQNRKRAAEDHGWVDFNYPISGEYYKPIDSFLISSFSWSLTPQKDAFWRHYQAMINYTCDNNPLLRKLINEYKVRFKYI